MLKYAKKQVEQKEEEIADLKDRLVGLGQAKELEKDLLQKQLNDLKNEINDLRERFEAENGELSLCITALPKRLTRPSFIFRKPSS